MENKIHGYVYLITNLINSMQYVGQTVRTIEKRFEGHIKDAKRGKTYINRAIKKYGIENFKIEEIDMAYNQKELNLIEGVYMAWFNTLVPNGYNLTDIINGKGKMHELSKEKLRIKANTPERLKIQSKIGKNNRGKSLGGKSKYIGVTIQNNKYISRISIDNKRLYLGSYNLESDAAKAYDIAAIKYFGNDATLNFHELIENYINGKTIVDKNTPQDYSKSGQRGIWFDKSVNKWVFKWIDKDKNRAKTFKTIEDAIKFKNNIEINID